MVDRGKNIMPQSYTRIIVHTTFSTKYRKPWILPRWEQGLYQFLDARLRAAGCRVFGIGGVLDHVHLVHSLPATKSIAKVLEIIKTESSHWMKKQGCSVFYWQNGYASFSVDYRNMEGIQRYVERQKLHHYGSMEGYAEVVKLSFEQEFRRLLDAYGVAYEERWLFETDPAGAAGELE